jgi:phage terminase large subunit-like protein
MGSRSKWRLATYVSASLAALLRSLPEAQRLSFLASLPDKELLALRYEWAAWARDTQLPPPGAWTIWLILAGRGFGKTRTGAEWVRDQIKAGRAGRLALMGRTAADVRDVMVEGESGILAISPPDERPRYEPSPSAA